MEIPTALITGGSRGVGAATAVALAEHGFDIAVTYRNKQARADEVVNDIHALGQDSIALGGDLTANDEREILVQDFQRWRPAIHTLILNASGGLERNKAPSYPMAINHDAQVGMLELCKPLLAEASTVVFVTSHWAHLFGQIEQLPHYGPVAESKFRGEQAVRAQQQELASLGARLLIATGDVVDGTITAKLLNRKQPGLLDSRRDEQGELISTTDMGHAIADAVLDRSLPSGHTVVIGAPLGTLA